MKKRYIVYLRVRRNMKKATAAATKKWHECGAKQKNVKKIAWSVRGFSHCSNCFFFLFIRALFAEIIWVLSIKRWCCDGNEAYTYKRQSGEKRKSKFWFYVHCVTKQCCSHSERLIRFTSAEHREREKHASATRQVNKNDDINNGAIRVAVLKSLSKLKGKRETMDKNGQKM